MAPSHLILSLITCALQRQQRNGLTAAFFLPSGDLARRGTARRAPPEICTRHTSVTPGKVEYNVCRYKQLRRSRCLWGGPCSLKSEGGRRRPVRWRISGPG